MVTIPVKLDTATSPKDVRFRLLHKEDHAPIEEKRFCTADGEEVAWEDLVRGYEVSKGEFIILGPEEIDAAKPESSTTIDIGDSVLSAEIDPVYFEKSYFLEPTDIGIKPFSLLKRALEETERMALARVTIRTRERLATSRAYEETLMLETMFWPDETARPALSIFPRVPRPGSRRRSSRWPTAWSRTWPTNSVPSRTPMTTARHWNG